MTRSALEVLNFGLAAANIVYANKAYNHYVRDDLLAQSAQLTLKPIRRSNSSQTDYDCCTNRLRQQTRRRIASDTN